jgi:hypothetical protein
MVEEGRFVAALTNILAVLIIMVLAFSVRPRR